MGRNRKGDDKCIMITFGTRDELGIHFKIEVTAVGEDVVNAHMRIDTCMVKGEVWVRGTEECGIIEGAKTRLEEVPRVVGWIGERGERSWVGSGYAFQSPARKSKEER